MGCSSWGCKKFADKCCQCFPFDHALVEGSIGNTPVDDGLHDNHHGFESPAIGESALHFNRPKASGEIGAYLDISLLLLVWHAALILVGYRAACAAGLCSAVARACKGADAEPQGRREALNIAATTNEVREPADTDGPAQRPPPRLHVPAPLTVPQVPGATGCHGTLYF